MRVLTILACLFTGVAATMTFVLAVAETLP